MACIWLEATVLNSTTLKNYNEILKKFHTQINLE